MSFKTYSQWFRQTFLAVQFPEVLWIVFGNIDVFIPSIIDVFIPSFIYVSDWLFVKFASVVELLSELSTLLLFARDVECI